MPTDIVAKFVFDKIDNAEELRLDYDVTILPPKKYFLPQKENLMTFDLDKSFNVKEIDEIKPRILIGVHPYDIAAILQTDKVYLDSKGTPIYKLVWLPWIV